MAGAGGRIRGVFIGIDRYQAPEINELRYAERDARSRSRHRVPPSQPGHGEAAALAWCQVVLFCWSGVA